MATVVVTFLITFHVYKMDADCKKRPRDRVAQRQKRWSMNSQRLEEIVAELMRPISDVRHSFDMDLCTLLEEYLTEAGLHALEASERPGSPAPGGCAAPNFAELALLLQQSASIYGRKVDFLYQHVLDVSDSLHNSSSTLEVGSPRAEESPSTPGSRRKRKASSGLGAGSFEPLELCPCAGARREAGPARPPPTLPRLYAELAPRAVDPRDLQLRDYGGEPVGLLADLHVAWRLQDGLLVDELEDPSGAAPGAGGGPLRPVPLLELQAAIEAAAPRDPPPPPPTATPPPASPPPPPATPSPPATPPPDPPPLGASTPEVVEKCTIAKTNRKRKSQDKIDDLIEGSISKVLSKKAAARLCGTARREFSVPGAWLRNTVHARAAAVRALRRLLAARAHCWTEFRGFEPTDATDVGGFNGWSATEVEAAGAALRASAGLTGGVGGAAPDDSDDDGFFELSEPGESDASRAGDSPVAAHTAAGAGAPATPATPVAAEGKPVGPASPDAAAAAELAAWRARVAAGAAAAERRQLDVRRLAARVLAALPASPAPPAPPAPALPAPPAPPAPAVRFDRVLAAAAADHTDVSRLFLATLFLANAGSVEVVGAAPLTLGGFSLRRTSPDAHPALPGALDALPGALSALPSLPDALSALSPPPAPR